MQWGMELALVKCVLRDFRIMKAGPMLNRLPLPDFTWILMLGGFMGWLTSLFVKGSGLGLLGDISVGVIGAFLGGFLSQQAGIEIMGFWEDAWLSVMGSVFLLTAYRVFSPKARAA